VAPERRELPRFQRIALDHYTCVPVPGYEKDPAVTAAILEFDPQMIPLWRVQRWRTPEGEVSVVHHGIGRYFPAPRYMRRYLRVEMPMDARGPAPNMLDVILEDDTTLQYKQGGWGAHHPWDWSVYAWCRFQYDKNTLEAWLKRSAAKQERLAHEREAIMAELEYRKQQIEPFLLKKAAGIAPSDWKKLVAAQSDPRSARELRPRKPFVDLGDRSPRSKETHLRVAPAKGVA